MFPNKFPYSNMHDLNLDWIIKKLNSVSAMYKDLYETIAQTASDYIDAHLPDILGNSLNTFVGDVNASIEELHNDITALQGQIGTVGSVYPTVVTLAADMTDPDVIYLYAGNEAGYTGGDWYYYDAVSESWVDGGTYGTGRITTNGRNLLLDLLRNVPYIYEYDADNIITALGTELSTPMLSGYRSISFALVNVTSSENAQSVQYGNPFTCTLAPASGYAQIDSITVTMGGSDVTASVYNNGSIMIPSVTGDVVVTAAAEWEIVRSFTSDDLTTGRNKINPPYYQANSTSQQRVMYVAWDLSTPTGYTYKIEYTTTVTGYTTNVGYQFYNQVCLDTVNASGTIDSTTMMYDPGWQDSGAEITPPAEVNNSPIVGLRFTFRAGDGTTVITASNFPTVLLTRKAV